MLRCIKGRKRCNHVTEQRGFIAKTFSEIEDILSCRDSRQLFKQFGLEFLLFCYWLHSLMVSVISGLGFWRQRVAADLL